jgi:hypothetical protein
MAMSRGLPYDFDKTTRGHEWAVWQRTAVGEKDHDIFVLPIGCATLSARVAAEACLVSYDPVVAENWSDLSTFALSPAG